MAHDGNTITHISSYTEDSGGNMVSADIGVIAYINHTADNPKNRGFAPTVPLHHNDDTIATTKWVRLLLQSLSLV